MAQNSTQITESLIQRETKCQKLENIKHLSLSWQNITDLDTSVLNRLTSLTTLDLSHNEIKTIPSDLSLKKLQTLDLTGNQLTSVDFVEHLPKLDALYVEDNDDLEQTDLLLAVTKCVSLKKINGESAAVLGKIAKQTRDKFDIQVKTKWEVLFAAKFVDGIPEDQLEQVTKDFTNSLLNDPLLDSATTKFEVFMLQQLAQEVLDAAKNGSLFSESNGSRGTPRSARLNHLYIQSGKPTPTDSTPSRPRRSLLDTSTQRSSTPATQEVVNGKGQKRRRDSSTAASDHTNRIKAMRSDAGRVASPMYTTIKKKEDYKMKELPPVTDYDPAYFVRCHSEDNSPGDDVTKIWRCVFEPKASNPDEHTNIVATCGGKIVCLIDCQTGKVMKRFKDNDKKESFFSLAWTTIPGSGNSDTNTTNILAVAGSACDVKLIHPSQLVMYAVLEGHRRYISCLVFHPTKPTYLFSGGNDNRIIWWDIGIPNFSDYTTDHKKMMVLKTPGTDALNLSITPKCDLLLAGCESTCYVWKIDKLKSVNVTPDMNLILPRIDDSESDNDDDRIVDGLAILPNDYVVTKCVGQSCLSLWNMRDCIPANVKGVKPKKGCVIPRALLQYKQTTVDYIYLSSSKGLVAVGDDCGCVRLYDLEKLIKYLDTESDTILQESRVLEWPDISLGRFSHSMQDLADCRSTVINTVTIHSTSQYVVCGTDNNLVCIWKKSTL